MTPSGTFSVAPGVLATLGLPIERICERAGVRSSNAWTTTDFFRLWASADAELCDRSAGIRFGAQGVIQGYSVASIVALHAPDFRSALAALDRYKRLTCPERIEVELDTDEAIIRYRWLAADGDVPRLLVDTTMASLRELVRRGTAAKVAPIRLELARRPEDHELLRRHFGCPITFEATHNVMVFSRAALDVPFVTADGGAFADISAGLEQELADDERFCTFLSDVRVHISRQLSQGRRPSIAAVAHRLNISSRTLQRRLDASSTTFQQQLSAVRRTTSSRLLINTDLDVVAIAMLLGFEEPNSFLRAFRAWEQTTPLRWRKQRISDKP